MCVCSLLIQYLISFGRGHGDTEREQGHEIDREERLKGSQWLETGGRSQFLRRDVQEIMTNDLSCKGKTNGNRPEGRPVEVDKTQVD